MTQPTAEPTTQPMTRAMSDTLPGTGLGRRPGAWLQWLPLGLGSAQTVPCAFLLVASLYRVSIGATSLFAAGAAQPFLWFHQDAIRLPLFAIAGLGAAINLYLLWNAHRLRNRPAAAWRRAPLTAKDLRVRRFQLWSSVATLAIIAADFASHAWMARHPLH